MTERQCYESDMVHTNENSFCRYVGWREHSVEEVLERPTGYPKVGGSNHGSGDFSLQPQRNPYLS